MSWTAGPAHGATGRRPQDRGKSIKSIDVIAAVLLVVGGLNGGLVGLFDKDLVAGLFGEMSLADRLVHSLVGVGAICQAATWRAIRRRWQPAAEHA